MAEQTWEPCDAKCIGAFIANEGDDYAPHGWREIQRCDECNHWDDDLDAIYALYAAAHCKPQIVAYDIERGDRFELPHLPPVQWHPRDAKAFYLFNKRRPQAGRVRFIVPIVHCLGLGLNPTKFCVDCSDPIHDRQLEWTEPERCANCASNAAITFHACATCGCTDVQAGAWIHVNSGEILADEPPWESNWCPRCAVQTGDGSTSFVETTELDPYPDDEE